MSVYQKGGQGQKWTFTDNSDEVKKAMESNIVKALTAVGMKAEGDVKLKIREPKMHRWGDKDHPKFRGSVDQGRLRNSITNKVMPEKECVVIGTNVEYAPYVEFGTRNAPAYPFLKNTISENMELYKDMIRHYLKGGE